MEYTTANLLQGHPGLAAFDDKVYLSAQIVCHSDPGIFNVFLLSRDPVVWLNAGWREKGGGRGYLVSDLQKDRQDGRSLLSAGCFLWKNDELVLLRRDAGAPSFAGALTEAAGRCGELPSKTMIKELNEEMLIALDLNGDKTVLGLTNSMFDMQEVLNVKARQHFGKVTVVQAEPRNMPNLKSNAVRIHLDGVLVDQIDGCSWFDEANNTLEVRQSFGIPDDYTLVSVSDGEPYGREARLMTLDALHGERLTPCLAQVEREYALATRQQAILA